ncbi:MAG TPA: hypothetical protein VFL14_05340 [Xanthomonadales bacterium]|nr:hypothetical protein [Xanthomonadales bacterium]
MADGWLFRLSATLGARQSAPSWPSAPTPAVPGDAAPALRVATPERAEAAPPPGDGHRSG